MRAIMVSSQVAQQEKSLECIGRNESKEEDYG